MPKPLVTEPEIDTRTMSDQNAIDNPEFLVNYGKSGAIGRFSNDNILTIRRGQSVVVRTIHGLELGRVLCNVRPTHRQVMTDVQSGSIVRLVTAEDHSRLEENQNLAQVLFSQIQEYLATEFSNLSLLDVEVVFDGQLAILHVLTSSQSELDDFSQKVHAITEIDIKIVNLALPIEMESTEGCGKADCGKSSGSCGSCSSGGCSSCGSGVSVREYFEGLRQQMEIESQTSRMPLL